MHGELSAHVGREVHCTSPANMFDSDKSAQEHSSPYLDDVCDRHEPLGWGDEGEFVMVQEVKHLVPLHQAWGIIDAKASLEGKFDGTQRGSGKEGGRGCLCPVAPKLAKEPVEQLGLADVGAANDVGVVVIPLLNQFAQGSYPFAGFPTDEAHLDIEGQMFLQHSTRLVGEPHPDGFLVRVDREEISLVAHDHNRVVLAHELVDVGEEGAGKVEDVDNHEYQDVLLELDFGHLRDKVVWLDRHREHLVVVLEAEAPLAHDSLRRLQGLLEHLLSHIHVALKGLCRHRSGNIPSGSLSGGGSGSQRGGEHGFGQTDIFWHESGLLGFLGLEQRPTPKALAEVIRHEPVGSPFPAFWVLLILGSGGRRVQ